MKNPNESLTIVERQVVGPVQWIESKLEFDTVLVGLKLEFQLCYSSSKMITIMCHPLQSFNLAIMELGQQRSNFATLLLPCFELKQELSREASMAKPQANEKMVKECQKEWREWKKKKKRKQTEGGEIGKQRKMEKTSGSNVACV